MNEYVWPMTRNPDANRLRSNLQIALDELPLELSPATREFIKTYLIWRVMPEAWGTHQ